VLLNTIATPGATYLWTSDSTNFTSNVAIPGVIYPEETATYLVTTTLGNCSNNYKVKIRVFNPNMVVTADTTICAGEPIEIGADAFVTGTYLWTPGGTTATFTDTLNTSSQYTLRFDYGDGCFYEDTVNVTVRPNFTLKLVSDPDTNRINAGVPIDLDAFVPGTNVSNFTFEWLMNNIDPVGNTQQITVNPVTMDSTVSYYVTVTSPNGCTQTGFLTFTIVQSSVEIPNAFSPNGDGANDSFGLAILNGVATIEKMEIYSRWGQKVFASNEPNARWDGNIDGSLAPSDVYVFVIFYRNSDGALQFASGDVTLLR
jgi:gliding motility-associated-like protein